VWITGLSGAGKTTLARAVVAAARDQGREVVLLDSDDLRAGISGRVGHTTAERRALARRYSDLCRFLASQGLDVICATMSLFREIQEWNRAHVPNYHEVYLRVSPARLGARDPKGLYRRAQDTPVVANVVGVDLPFDEPGTPDLVIDNDADRGDLSPLVAQVMGLFRG
jgi:cytidine diphosphoramidate kinase